MKVVAIVSGGLDSVTLAHCLHDEYEDLHLVSFNYGQRHQRELACAAKCADRLDVPWHLVDLSGLSALLPSVLTAVSGDVPEGHYADESMKATVVPNRNAIMINIAAGVAVGIGAQMVAIGVHSGDHPVYPDCRPEFIAAQARALALATEGLLPDPLLLLAPFLLVPKSTIVRIGASVGRVPFQETWSCYKGGVIHCGRCSTCVERQEAFATAGVDDPTEYEDADYWRTVTANVEA